MRDCRSAHTRLESATGATWKHTQAIWRHATRPGTPRSQKPQGAEPLFGGVDAPGAANMTPRKMMHTGESILRS